MGTLYGYIFTLKCISMGKSKFYIFNEPRLWGFSYARWFYNLKFYKLLYNNICYYLKNFYYLPHGNMEWVLLLSPSYTDTNEPKSAHFKI